MRSNTPKTTAFHKVGQNLYRLASGRYYGLVKRGGKQFRRSLKTKDRKLAERRLVKLRDKVGRLTLQEEADSTFEDVAKAWMQETSHTLKPASVHRREICIKALKPYFAKVPVRNVTPDHCKKWLVGRGREIAAQTFAHELDAMKAVFNTAVSKGLMMENPASAIKRRKIPQAKIVVPTREQFQILVAAIRQSDGRPDSQTKAKPGADLIELLAFSGCRLSEATALCWSDVSFERNCLTITGGDRGTKNSEARTVPMTGALRELLERLKKERKPQPDDPVSPISNCKTALRKACTRLALPGFTHHDFRHFFATTAIESGVDIPTISRWLGHKDGGALCMRVYGHLRQEHSFAAIKRVNFDPTEAENVVKL